MGVGGGGGNQTDTCFINREMKTTITGNLKQKTEMESVLQ